LELFAYESYVEYKKNRKNFIELNPNQMRKLQMISILDQASKEKVSSLVKE